MKDYKITYVGDEDLKDFHHIGVECDGSYYSVIFGEYVNGYFCSIPNWNVGCDLSFNPHDVNYNEEKLAYIVSKRAAKAIANAITDYVKAKQ